MRSENNLVHDESSNKLYEIYHNNFGDISMGKINVDESNKLILNNENMENCESFINEKKTSSDHPPNYFNTLLCSRNLLLIKAFFSVTKNVNIWTTLENLFVYLMKNNFLTTDSLVEQFVSVYRQDWPQVIYGTC